MIVTKNIDFNEPLSEEELEMLKKLADIPAVPDEDCPELTDEQIKKLAESARIRRLQKSRNE